LEPFNSDGKFSPFTAESDLRRVAVKSAGITLLGQAASFGVQLASVMLLARLLTPHDFGLVTMVTTFSLLFRSFGLNGFTELVIQREDITHFLASNLFWIQLGIGALLTVVFAFSGGLVASFYHNPAAAPVVRGMSLTIGIGCLGWIHMGLLQTWACCNVQWHSGPLQ
jgi:PST family polysaccharide transporter